MRLRHYVLKKSFAYHTNTEQESILWGQEGFSGSAPLAFLTPEFGVPVLEAGLQRRTFEYYVSYGEVKVPFRTE